VFAFAFGALLLFSHSRAAILFSKPTFKPHFSAPLPLTKNISAAAAATATTASILIPAQFVFGGTKCNAPKTDSCARNYQKTKKPKKPKKTHPSIRDRAGTTGEGDVRKPRWYGFSSVPCRRE